MRIEPGHLLVVDHTVQPLFRLTITLSPLPGGTRLQWDQVFEDAEQAKAMAAIIEPANEQNLDRLSCELGL